MKDLLIKFLFAFISILYGYVGFFLLEDKPKVAYAVFLIFILFSVIILLQF